MISIDALVYDLDGTLIDSKVDLAIAVNAALTEGGRAPKSVELIAATIGDGARAMLERSFEDTTPALIEHGLEIFRAHYRAHCLDHTRLYPGVRATLEHFRAKGQAVVSNKPDDFTRMIVDGLGIAPLLPVVIGGSTARALKPDPAPIRAALAGLGVAPGRAVMVGDGLPDLEAGRRAGTRTCAVTYGLGARAVLAAGNPDYWIEEFGALKGLFK